MGTRSRQALYFVSLLLWAFAVSFASDETRAEHDNSRLSIFLQPSISFLSFDQRSYFQDAVDTIYKEFRASAQTESESLSVAKQNFQKVNFCFPVYGGLQFQPLDDQFISAGIGFIYDNESVVLTDRKDRSHNYSYTIQGVPIFLEYRLAIPLNLMTLTDGGLFSIAIRWYWTLPGTEIYTTWGKIGAENSPLGAGFGVSIGYLIASWHGINVYGDIGYSSISVESKKSFADIVPDGPEEKAKWNIGGLQLQIRVSFGLWDKTKKLGPNEESAADSSVTATVKDSTADSSVTATVKDSTADSSATARDSASADSATSAAATAMDTAATTAADSAGKDTTAADSAANPVADSTANTSAAGVDNATADSVKAAPTKN